MVERGIFRLNFRGYWLLVVTLILSACTMPLGGYGVNGQTKEEFTRYVEGVFRLQNSITSDLMLEQEAGEADPQNALSIAEQAMHKACVALDEYAARDSEGLSTGLWLRRKVEKSAGECEQAALKVKALLRH